MKRDTFGAGLCAAALAFLLGFGGTMCMVTGLRLPAEIQPLAVGCALGAVIPAVCLCFRRGELVLSGIAALFTVLVAFSVEFQEQLLALCFSVLDFYHKGYGISIPAQIEGCTAESQLLPLLFIAGIVMVAAVWTVMRKTTSIPTVLLAVLPLVSCLVVTDTVPEAVPIFLLVLGLILLIMTQSIRRQNTANGNRLTAILALPAAAALALLFFLIPQETYSAPTQISSVDDLLSWVSEQIPALEKTSDGKLVFSYGSSAKEQVDLSAVGNRIERNTPVMEVTTDYSGTLYLRGQDFDVYTGLDWQASKDQTKEVYGMPTVWQAPSHTVAIRTLGRHSLFYLPCYPTKVQTLTGGMIPNPANISTYSYSFSPLRSDWKELLKNYTGSQLATHEMPTTVFDVELYWLLPEDTKAQALDILKQMELSDAAHDVDVAEAIVDFVRQSAIYDTGTDPMPAGESDFALWFLNSSDTGYCVHFATAATVLLRAAGIPARYVEGYAVSTIAGETTLVREKDAHAWVECYLPYAGWVILDPTPGIAEPPVESTTVPSTEPTETEPPEATQETQPPSSSTAPDLPSDATAATPSNSTQPSSDPVQTSLPQWFTRVLAVIFFAAVAAFLITGQWYLRRWLTMKRMQKGSTNTRAITRYREAVRLEKLSRTQIPDTLQELAEKAKFSQHKLTDEELKQFDRFLQSCTATLEKRPWYCRLIYRFIFAAY